MTAVHSVSFVQGAAQPVGVQGEVPHAVLTAGAQTPLPSQVRAARKVAPEQLEAAHDWPEPNLRHPPAPSQRPSLPQVSGVDAWQLSWGSSPPVTAAHVPLALPV